MIFDLGWKTFKMNRIKKKMPKWKRYYSFSNTKKILYIAIVTANVVYVAYRLYCMVALNIYTFNAAAVVLPVALYYVILDYTIGGIYFNRKSVYYTSNYGTVLQAQATVIALQQMGLNAEIIDYRPEYNEKTLRVINLLPNSVKTPSPCRLT